MDDKKFSRKFWLTTLFLLLIATVACYIFTLHEAHILALYSSYIIIIIFILLHILMHRGHGHHHRHRRDYHKNKLIMKNSDLMMNK
ncbi:DUF2933 domain-containing protein [Methanobacterium sp.]|uniref:DUF2933 domain-containing protein n=1 Tax=Methanobacterium sp. TaxID=2164 RepID=UPI003C71F989